MASPRPIPSSESSPYWIQKASNGRFVSGCAGVIPALRHEQVIAIDGKTSRRTTSKAAAAPLHMVSAFAAEVGLVLGQLTF
jgi:hypothetical protein